MPERHAPRLLFVPVSGAYGMGEYARSLAIARAALVRWSAADIHFMLSRQAPYAAGVPFPVTLLPASPTLHSDAVIESLKNLRPDVAIFDNAGRTLQLRSARDLGARVVFISARPRQRRRAFRLRWMRLIDEHWIAYPEFVAGSLSSWENFKLRRLGRPVLRFLDVIAPHEAPAAATQLEIREAGIYVLLVPGGGTGHPGSEDAARQFFGAAEMLAARGVQALFVGPGDTQRAQMPGLRCIGRLPQAQLLQWMRGARVIVTNGGSTLLQAIAAGAACIAVPIAKDQAHRAKRCVQAGLAHTAPLRSAPMAAAAGDLVGNDAARAALTQRAAQLHLADGIAVALDGLSRLLRHS